MVGSAGDKLQAAIRKNPYNHEDMRKTEDYLIENEVTGVGWYWARNGQPIAFGSCRKPEKKVKLPAYDWKKQKRSFK